MASMMKRAPICSQPVLTNKVLFVYVDCPDDVTSNSMTPSFSLKRLYQVAANNHNEMVDKNPYPDSGFDVYYPEADNSLEFESNKPIKIDFKISAAMYDINTPIAYTLHARSSISKTGLRLANNIGIIDSGYRGHLCGFFDPILGSKSLDGKFSKTLGNFNSEYKIEQSQRLLQICSSDLKPFKVIIVDNISDLGMTDRGGGGFGSTGTSGVKS